MFEDQMYLDQQDASDRFCQAVYASLPPEDLGQAYERYVSQCRDNGWEPVSWEIFLRG